METRSLNSGKTVVHRIDFSKLKFLPNSAVMLLGVRKGNNIAIKITAFFLLVIVVEP